MGGRGNVSGKGKYLLLEILEFLVFFFPVAFYLFLRFVPGVFDTLRSVWNWG